MRKTILTFLLVATSLALMAQEKPKPDSIQVYQIIALPQSINSGYKIISEKFRPKNKTATYADSVLFDAAIGQLLGGAKLIKIANPDKEVKKINSPKNK